MIIEEIRQKTDEFCNSLIKYQNKLLDLNEKEALILFVDFLKHINFGYDILSFFRKIITECTGTMLERLYFNKHCLSHDLELIFEEILQKVSAAYISKLVILLYDCSIDKAKDFKEINFINNDLSLNSTKIPLFLNEKLAFRYIKLIKVVFKKNFKLNDLSMRQNQWDTTKFDIFLEEMICQLQKNQFFTDNDIGIVEPINVFFDLILFQNSSFFNNLLLSTRYFRLIFRDLASSDDLNTSYLIEIFEKALVNFSEEYPKKYTDRLDLKIMKVTITLF